MTPSLRTRTLAGLKWNGVNQAVCQLLSTAFSICLSRILSPREYGLLGMIAVFTGAAWLFRELGLGAALIQKKDLEERHLSSIYWVNLATGAALSAAFALAAPLVAGFFSQPVLRAMMAVTGLNFVISSLTTVQRNLMMRRLEFRSLFFIDLLSVLLGGAASLAAALHGFGVWSLVIQILAITVVATAATWVLSEWKPKAVFDRSALEELLGYSANLLGWTMLDYSNRNLDNLLVGRFFGPEPLGAYARAYDLMLMPISQITRVISRVMFPAMSEIQHDHERLRRIYLKATRAIALITFPLMIGLLLTARPFVRILYGDKWLAVVPIIRVFCLAGMLDSITATTEWLFNSQGRTDLRFRWGLFDFAVVTTAFFVGLPWGVQGVAWGYVASVAIRLVPNWTVAGRLIGLKFSDLAWNFAHTLLCAAAMGVVVWKLGAWVPEAWAPAEKLGVRVVVGASVYLALVHFSRLRAYLEVRTLVQEQLG